MRLFVAVAVGTAVSRSLGDITARLKAGGYPVKWVRDDAHHVTLKFLGETDESLLPALTGLLDRVASRFQGFELEYEGCGAFPNLARPRTLWAGCVPHPTLELIQHDLETGLAGLGFDPEGRPFRPHVTLGRAKRDAPRPEMKRLGLELEQVELFGTDFIESVDLMSSVLGPGGARYDCVHRAILGVV